MIAVGAVLSFASETLEILVEIMGGNESHLRRQQSTLHFLNKPVTHKDGEDLEQPHLISAVSHMQGWRAHMEDEHVMQADIPDMPGWGFFAVLDGHAGKVVAEYSAKNLLDVILHEVRPTRNSLAGIQDGLIRGFMKHDLAMQSSFEVLKDRSGSTCTSVLITPTHYFFANCGDSRAVLWRGGKPVFASEDHKPTDVPERTRIVAAGGMVINERVDGGLAVSRAFGDFEYKMRSDLPQYKQRVIAMPDVTVVPRQFVEEEFILLACDGIWDVMSNVGATKFLNQRIKKGDVSSIRTACDRLIKRCLELGSRDNMSALVIVPKLDYKVPEPTINGATLSKEDVAEKMANSLVFHVIRSGVSQFVAERNPTKASPIRAALSRQYQEYQQVQNQKAQQQMKQLKQEEVEAEKEKHKLKLGPVTNILDETIPEHPENEDDEVEGEVTNGFGESLDDDYTGDGRKGYLEIESDDNSECAAEDMEVEVTKR